MRHGSLFSGIGGFDLAAEWMGWENVFHCEIDKFPRTLLNHYWPNAISYEDIKQTDFTIHRGGIDILTGGFPCQPYSSAGKRLGKEDDRHLWPEMLRAVREIQPGWILGENVRGLVNWNGGMVFDEVQADLEAEGYEVLPIILPASAINAPHRRDRVWIVAYSHKRATRSSRSGDKAQSYAGKYDDEPSGRRKQTKQHSGRCDVLRSNPDTTSKSSERLQPGQQKVGCAQQGKSRGKDRAMGNKHTPNTHSDQRPEGRLHKIRPKSADGNLSSFNTRNDWRAWENFPTQSPICSGDDGLSRELDGITFSKWRQESVKAFGNAVVPQVVFEIFKVIQEIHLSTIRRKASI